MHRSSRSKLPYDPIRDFAPIGRIAVAGLVLVVVPESPFHTLADITRAAKEQPGKLTFGSELGDDAHVLFITR